MKLYYNPESRATITRWMLEECGADYELVHIDLKAREHKAPAFLAINPAGKLPAMVDGELRMFESSAICLYLADRYPEAQLAPGIDDPRRGRYLALCVYANTQLDPAMGDVMLKTEVSNYRGWTDWQTVIDLLTRELGEGPYFLGDQFTAADVLIGSELGWFRMFGNTLPPVLNDYVDRVTQRPAAGDFVGR